MFGYKNRYIMYIVMSSFFIAKPIWHFHFSTIDTSLVLRLVSSIIYPKLVYSMARQFESALFIKTTGFSTGLSLRKFSIRWTYLLYNLNRSMHKIFVGTTISKHVFQYEDE